MVKIMIVPRIKIILLAAGVVIAAGIIAVLLYLFLPRWSLTVYDQPLGTALHIEDVRLFRPGFVVPHEADIYGRPALRLPAIPLALPAGAYRNVNVLFDPDEEALPGDVVVVVYEDNGDGQFDQQDSPARLLSGEIVQRKIRLE